jgi:hypothetical protein
MYSILKDQGFTKESGLVQHLDDAQNNYERLYFEDKKRFSVVPTAIFFRRFYKNEEESPYLSTIAVYIFNTKDTFFNTEHHKTLHAELWSAGNAEIYILLGDTRIDIINARKPAKQEGKDVTLDDESLHWAADAMKEFEYAKFSAHLFGSGTFWEQADFQNKIDSNSNPYVFLLNYLMEVRKQLQSNVAIKLSAETIDKLLITSILIKFLEEIKNDDDKHTLKMIYKQHNLKTEKFEDGLRNGTCLNILGDLASQFNGKIFNIFTQEEKANIANTDLTLIANFLSADIDVKTQQAFLWKQYSFKHLPAEVISGIYENFIQAESARNDEKRKDVVYTPIHLVNLMIDEAMPLEHPELFQNESFRVLDPACGSGVFLVAAYKRMLQWWTINHWRETKKITYPDKETARKILESNIFGVDIEKTAALVSIFSLTTAFLDKLTPKEIWNDLKFDALIEKNIQGEVNFINWAKASKANNECFDLVIGNPPFNETPKGKITNEDFKKVFGKDVPMNKLSLKFFEAALFFGEKVCMVIPSNVFLYNKNDNTHKYRERIFTDYTVEKIFDFTHLRRVLFHKSADTPIIALLLQKKPSEYQSIEHIIVKRELFSEQKMRFEIGYYDKHQVRWDWAIDKKKHFVWKTNLLGGGRLFHLVYRLSLLETLDQFIDERKKENHEWLYQSGYKTGGNNTKKKHAKFVDNGDRIDSIKEDGTYTIDYSGEITNMLESFPPETMYIPPFVVIDQVYGDHNIPIVLVETHDNKKYLYFNRNFVGIHAPIDEIRILENIFFFIKEKYASLYRFLTIINSGSCLILTETEINKRDLDNLPFPHQEDYLKLAESEKIIQDDVLNYYIHLGKAITKKSAGYCFYAPIVKLDIALFGAAYCKILNEIYAENDNSWQMGKVLYTSTFVIYQFGFGENNGLQHTFCETTEQHIGALLSNIKSNGGIHYQRIIRYYEHKDVFDCVYFIKPNAKRYWLPSIALRDADDTFMDLKQNGY